MELRTTLTLNLDITQLLGELSVLMELQDVRMSWIGMYGRYSPELLELILKGDRVENRHTTFHPFFRNISPSQYRQNEVMHQVKLYTCDSVNPPEYLGESLSSLLCLIYRSNNLVKELCVLKLDLKTLPPNAMSRQTRGGSEYWRVDYDLGLYFGPAGIEFRLVYEGQIRSLVNSDYQSQN